MDTRASISNLPDNKIALTECEAGELLESLEKLVNSREFLESSFFVEGLTLPGTQEEHRVREIYLTARKRHGRSRAQSSRHWSDFKVRLGIEKKVYMDTKTTPMSYDYFRRMEIKLLEAAEVHPRVIDLIMRTVDSQNDMFGRIRLTQASLDHGTIRKSVMEPFLRWREQPELSKDQPLSKNRFACAITIIADLSVLFGTRDWSVTGTISTMAAALASLDSD